LAGRRALVAVAEALALRFRVAGAGAVDRHARAAVIALEAGRAISVNAAEPRLLANPILAVTASGTIRVVFASEPTATTTTANAVVIAPFSEVELTSCEPGESKGSYEREAE
jgi:hypothetical protein